MKKDKPVTYEQKYLLAELIQTRNALAAAYSTFDNVVDPDLIDSCIYQVNATQLRYKFLLERAKESNVDIKCDMEIYTR